MVLNAKNVKISTGKTIVPELCECCDQPSIVQGVVKDSGSTDENIACVNPKCAYYLKPLKPEIEWIELGPIKGLNDVL
jgi:hypothetical protein